MGVPGLFPWIVKTFPHAVAHFRAARRGAVDRVLIDANGLLHRAAQRVYNYGDRARMLDPYAELAPAAKLRKTFEVFFGLVREVAAIMPPTELLFLAIDGPAPAAKQQQQRQRRYVAARDRGGTATPFDSNCITPGTLFMFRLTQYLNYAIRREIARGAWRRLRVVFSPGAVPGEGEHKIMEFIRAGPRGRTTCFYGLDGDLIMLTLAAAPYCRALALLREDQYTPGYYHTVDVGALRAGLAANVRPVAPRRRPGDVVNDFIVLGFFVGNDFLPKLQMFYHLADGLDTMLAEYHPLTREGKLDLASFARFVARVARRESGFLAQQAQANAPAPEFVDRTLLACIRRDGSLDRPAYRAAYYAKAGVAAASEIEAMCAAYLRGIAWVAEYYVRGLPSWTWSYGYHYAPLLEDFARYLAKRPSYPRFDRGAPSRPVVQLLSVLPLASAALLPRAYRRLMLAAASPLVRAGAYPAGFDVDYEGKTKAYKGVVLLPFLDRRAVEDAYASVPAGAPLKRDAAGREAVFYYDASFAGPYASRYGDLGNTHVRRVTSGLAREQRNRA